MGLFDNIFGSPSGNTNKNNGADNYPYVSRTPNARRSPQAGRTPIVNRQPTHEEVWRWYNSIDYLTEGNIPLLVDSLNIISETTNPGTYFSRYRIACEEALAVTRDRYPFVVWHGMTAPQINSMLGNRESSDQMHMQFIDRLFLKGREDRLTYSMYEVGGHMSSEVLEYFMEKLHGKKYHFCRVRFNDYKGRIYTYLAKDRSISVGDTITVPTGNEYKPDTKILQVEETFDASLEELEFPIRKLRCVERRLRSIICPHCGASIEITTSEKKGICTRCQSEFYFI